MSKEQERKKKERMIENAKVLSLKFQVGWEKERLMPDLPDDDQRLKAEFAAIRGYGLVGDFLTLYDIMAGIKNELGIVPEQGRGTFSGTLIPYLLGFSSSCPDKTCGNESVLPEMLSARKPLQVKIFFDNEVRNIAVNWIKDHYAGVSTRLGQPILKLMNMVVEFRRVVKQ